MPVQVNDEPDARTTLTCDFCGAEATHVRGTHSPLMEEYFTARRWVVYDPTERDGEGQRHVVACPLCTPIVRTVSREIDLALTQALRSSR